MADTAERLGISEDAVRKRLRRGTLAGGKDADIALRVHDVAQQLTPEAKADLLKAFDWIERDIRERRNRGNL